jgi:ligand-binding sensor domain-containing protein
MAPLRALSLLLAASFLAGCDAPVAAPPAASGLAARAEVSSPEPPPEAPRPVAPELPADVLTDTRDVRACLPLAGGAVLAGTGGGLLLVHADGSVRKPWTALDGLPETRVHALLLDGGRLFIGTEGGLAVARLSGDALVIERGIPSKPVRALARHEGSVFAATWGDGVARLEGARGDLVPLRVARGAATRFTSLASFEGALVAGSASGAFRVSAGSLSPMAGTPASIWALAAGDGRLWIGGLGGLSSISAGVTRAESGSDVRALLADGGGLLAGTFGQGALALDAGRLAAIPGLDARAAFVQAVGASGATRCLGTREGLFVQRGAGARWEEARLPFMPSNDVAAVALQGDRLWVGTFDRGLAVLEGRRLRAVRDPAIDDKINALAVEGPRVWVATARGLASVEGERVTRYGEVDGLPSSEVHAVATLSTGGVLVGTARGAAIVEAGRVDALTEKHGVPVGGVWAVAEGAGGQLLLGTSRGLLMGTRASHGVVDRGAPAPAGGDDPDAPRPWVQLSMASGDLEDDWITSLAVHDRAVYVGTYNAGVTMLSAGEDGVLTPAQLGGGYVNMGGLLVSRGNLYAATMAGLLVRPARGDGAWRTLGGAAPGRDVTAVAASGKDLWVASRRGLSLYQPAHRARAPAAARAPRR